MSSRISIKYIKEIVAPLSSTQKADSMSNVHFLWEQPSFQKKSTPIQGICDCRGGSEQKGPMQLPKVSTQTIQSVIITQYLHYSTVYYVIIPFCVHCYELHSPRHVFILFGKYQSFLLCNSIKNCLQRLINVVSSCLSTCLNFNK